MLIVIILDSLCVLVGGCRPFQVPCRVVSWGNMCVTKEGARSGRHTNERFTNLDWTRGSNTPAIAVRMPDGAFLRTDEMRKQTFDPYISAGYARAGEGGWDVVVHFPCAKVLILFAEDGSLKRLQVWSRDKHSYQNRSIGIAPAIQAIGSDKVLTFPLTEAELIEAFGKPTEDKTWCIRT